MTKQFKEGQRLKAARVAYGEAQEAKACGDLQGMAAKLNELGEVLKPEPKPKNLKDFPNLSVSEAVKWNDRHALAAIALAEGRTQDEAGEEIGVTGRTIRNWLHNVEFSAEVDRLSLMIGIAGRAERIRIAKRVIRQKATGKLVTTDKDVLDWLKFAQSETDGAKLDFGKLFAALGEIEAPVADSRPDRSGDPAESESVN